MKKFPKLEATRAYNADGTKMQCKHIPDIRILEFLYDHKGANVIDWRNEYDPTSLLFGTMTKAEVFHEVVTVKYDVTLDGISIKKGEGILVSFTNDVKQNEATLTVAGLFPPNVPQKLIRAKMNKLQNRGLIVGGDGSPSGNGKRAGSRFDAQITDEGMRYVESITHCDLF